MVWGVSVFVKNNGYLGFQPKISNVGTVLESGTLLVNLIQFDYVKFNGAIASFNVPDFKL